MSINIRRVSRLGQVAGVSVQIVRDCLPHGRRWASLCPAACPATAGPQAGTTAADLAPARADPCAAAIAAEGPEPPGDRRRWWSGLRERLPAVAVPAGAPRIRYSLPTTGRKGRTAAARRRWPLHP